jgi:hypothetical protein
MEYGKSTSNCIHSRKVSPKRPLNCLINVIANQIYKVFSKSLQMHRIQLDTLLRLLARPNNLYAVILAIPARIPSYLSWENGERQGYRLSEQGTVLAHSNPWEWSPARGAEPSEASPANAHSARLELFWTEDAHYRRRVRGCLVILRYLQLLA